MKISTGFLIIIVVLFSCKHDSKKDEPIIVKTESISDENIQNLHLKRVTDSLNKVVPKLSYYYFDLNHDQLKELMVYDVEACKLKSKCNYDILQYDKVKDNYKNIGHLKGAFQDLIRVKEGYDFINTGVPIDGSSYTTSRYSYINGKYRLTKDTHVKIKNGKMIETNLLKKTDSL
jgi:hypothetical protein|nr:hypothetical protein [uncultured Psychroserpens sp.]